VKKFKLEIELGNDAMRKAWEVGDAVESAMAHHATDRLKVGDGGRIMDVNGNKVGSWKVVEEKEGKKK
jgi:hypothetical protein